MNDTTQRKHLVLHIEIPGYWADDLDQCAAIYSEPDPPSPRDRLDVVLEEWMRETVGVTLVSIPGEKCGSDDFEIHAFTGRIVGAEARDIAGIPATAASHSCADCQPCTCVCGSTCDAQCKCNPLTIAAAGPGTTGGDAT